MLRRPALAGLVLATLALAGCGDALAPPEVRRADLAAASREIASQPPPLPQFRSAADDQAMLRRVAARTAAAARPFCEAERGRDCAFRLQMVADRAPNAFAHDDDRITVTTGLMRLVANEHELAAVVAHEMAHHVAGHVERTGRRVEIGARIGAAVGNAFGDVVGIGGGLAQIGAEAGARAAELGFSKAQEREADYLGAHIAARAGYDLERAGQLWVKLTQLSGDHRSSWLDSHPAGPERLVQWRLAAAEIARDPGAPPRRA